MMEANLIVTYFCFIYQFILKSSKITHFLLSIFFAYVHSTLTLKVLSFRTPFCGKLPRSIIKHANFLTQHGCMEHGDKGTKEHSCRRLQVLCLTNWKKLGCNFASWLIGGGSILQIFHAPSIRLSFMSPSAPKSPAVHFPICKTCFCSTAAPGIDLIKRKRDRS